MHRRLFYARQTDGACTGSTPGREGSPATLYLGCPMISDCPDLEGSVDAGASVIDVMQADQA
jgi:hypothetical protein